VTGRSLLGIGFIPDLQKGFSDLGGRAVLTKQGEETTEAVIDERETLLCM
jgi:hypothetical protein